MTFKSEERLTCHANGGYDDRSRATEGQSMRKTIVKMDDTLEV